MRRIALIALAALAACATPVPVVAQQDAAACAAMDASLPAGMADWNGGAVLKTATKADDIAQAMIATGTGYAASLARTTRVFMPAPPEKPGGSVSYSGLFAFTVETAGDYTVALGAAAWIDVLEDGKALEPSSFGHGPACTTIRKMVVFPLKPGLHALQVAGNGAETLKLMVTKKS